MIDKSGWGPGPWQNEPDVLRWKDEETGLDCLVRRAGSAGHLCGYVGVLPDHPWFGLGYMSDGVEAEVHGGLTWDGRLRPIPGVIEPGDLVYWFGFDCAHCGDLSPGSRAADRAAGAYGTFEGMYRDFDYVKDQCRLLAKQIHAVKLPVEDSGV